MSTNHARRLDALERSAPVVMTPETRAYAERLAREYNIAVNDIIAEAVRLQRIFGDAPVDVVIAGIAEEMNVTPDDLIAATRDIVDSMREAEGSSV